MPRMLHLGLGAFHRAHQAVFMQRLLDAGQRDWELAAGNLRGDLETGVRQLEQQQGRYTLETVDPQGTREYTVIEALRQVVGWDEQLSGLVALGADPATRIISFTVTEGGYALDAAGQLDTASPAMQAALESARRNEPGTTLHGALTAILRARMRSGAGPVTLLSCDNLRHNGDRTRTALLQFVQALGDASLAQWIEANTTCPNTMVDRITPRPTADVVDRVRTATGRDDPCALMAESFIQWVVEDRFVAGRPRWEDVGVQFTGSVDPFEEAKIRLLNASHSVLAWGGALAGHQYIHQAVGDARIHRAAFHYASEGAIPLLVPSPLDLPAYRDVVLARFGNADILDTVQRVASDSFAKVPAFFAPSVRERIARGLPLEPLALPAALLLAFLQRWTSGALPFEHNDQPDAARIAADVCAAPDPAQALARCRLLWGDASSSQDWIAAVQAAHREVQAHLG